MKVNRLMKLTKHLIFVLFASIGWLLISIGLAHADGITLSELSATYTFAQSITFNVQASSASPIQQATLFFQAGGQPPIKQAADIFTAANQVTLTAKIDLTQIKPPAFSTISYWWEVDDRSGQHLQSAAQSIAYIDNRFNWQDFTSGSIRVHWVQGDSGFGASAASIANNALPKIQQQIGARPPSPIDIYIYSSTQQLRSAVELAGQTWLGGLAQPEFGVVMIAIPNDETTLINLRRDVPHELTHLLVFVATTPNYRSVPRWLDEGLASLNEAEPNPAQAVALQNAFDANQLIPIESLCGAFPGDAASALIAYAESRGLVQQIVNEYGSAGLQALLAAYRDGATCDAGVERGLNDSLASLELKWKATLAPNSGAASIVTGVLPWLLLIAVIVLPLIALIPRRDKMKR
jgi:Peptidase MA superfamily